MKDIKLKEGQIFGIRINSLSPIRLVSDKNQYKVEYKIDYENNLCKFPLIGTVLLCKYLGNDLCEEFYTECQFPINASCGTYNVLKDSELLIEEYEKHLKYPIVISNSEFWGMSSSPFLDINDNFKIDFAKNRGFEKLIKNIIESEIEKARGNLKKDIAEVLYVRDFDNAYTENAIYDFQKRKIK